MISYNAVADVEKSHLVLDDVIQILGEEGPGDRSVRFGVVRPKDFVTGNPVINIQGDLKVEVLPETIVVPDSVKKTGDEMSGELKSPILTTFSPIDSDKVSLVYKNEIPTIESVGTNNGFNLSHAGKVRLRIDPDGEVLVKDDAKVFHEKNSYGLGVSKGVMVPENDLNKAVKSGFYGIYGADSNTPYDTGPSGSRMEVVAWSDQHVTQIFHRANSGEMWSRTSKVSGGVMTWDVWKKIYSQHTPLVASDFGAYSDKGGVIDGNVTANNITGRLTHSHNYIYINPFGSEYGSTSYARIYYKKHDRNNPGTINAGLYIESFEPAVGSEPSKMYPVNIWLNGKKVYHEDFVPTADKVGAAPVGFGLGTRGTGMGDQSGFMAYSATPASKEVPIAGGGWQSTYNTNRRAQLWVGQNDSVYSRFTTSSDVLDSTTPWVQHYTTKFKPTIAELGGAPDGYGLGTRGVEMGIQSGFMAYNTTPATGEVPIAGGGFQATYNTNRRAQLWLGQYGEVYSRFTSSTEVLDSTTPWIQHYTTEFKPTTRDIEVVDSVTKDVTSLEEVIKTLQEEVAALKKIVAEL